MKVTWKNFQGIQKNYYNNVQTTHRRHEYIPRANNDMNVVKKAIQVVKTEFNKDRIAEE